MLRINWSKQSQNRPATDYIDKPIKWVLYTIRCHDRLSYQNFTVTE